MDKTTTGEISDATRTDTGQWGWPGNLKGGGGLGAIGQMSRKHLASSSGGVTLPR